MRRNRITKRIETGALALLAAGMLCAGCAGDAAEIPADETAVMLCMETGIRMVSELSVEQPVEYEACTLRFSFWGDETTSREMEQAVSDFESEYPGIEVELVDGTAVVNGAETAEGTAGGWKDTLIQQLQSGTAPDINQIEWEWIHEYSADGTLFYDLYKEHDVVQLGAYGQEYLNLCTVAEELQALPGELSGKVFFFNEQLFARAGIEVPDTLEELMAAGEVFKTELGGEYYPLALTTQDRMELLVYYLESVCGKGWVVDGVLQYYVEDVQKGMEFLLSLEEAHVIPTLQYARSDESLSRDNGWSSGVYGGVFVDSCNCVRFNTMLPAGNSAVAADRFPDMGTGRGGYIEVAEAYAVSESSDYKREAALFLDFLLNREEENADETLRKAQEAAMEGAFAMNRDYAEMMKDDTLYSDVLIGLSYGDYNAREAAQLLLDSFGN